jgi:hypothetical protein
MNIFIKLLQKKYGTNKPYRIRETDKVFSATLDDVELDCEELNKEYVNMFLVQKAKAYLEATDWKVIRHRDQLDSGKQPSLSNEEYLQLLIDRQEKRNSID